MATADEFEALWIDSPERYQTLISALSSSAESVDFITEEGAGGVESDLPGRLAGVDPVESARVTGWPGMELSNSSGELRRYRATRPIWAALRSYPGFFDRRHTPRGDVVQFTEFGNVDVVFRLHSDVICYVTTHEGLVAALPGVAPPELTVYRPHADAPKGFR